MLVDNVWSLTDDKSGGSYNNLLVQPLLNYDFKGRLYLTTSPITANWKASSEDEWTVPIGGGVGKTFHLGKLPEYAARCVLQVEKPEFGYDWRIRAQVQFMFPK